MTKPTPVIHDVRIAHGEEGRRLAPLQAQAILDVLAWAVEQQERASEPPATVTDERPHEKLNKH